MAGQAPCLPLRDVDDVGANLVFALPLPIFALLLPVFALLLPVFALRGNCPVPLAFPRVVENYSLGEAFYGRKPQPNRAQPNRLFFHSKSVAPSE